MNTCIHLSCTHEFTCTYHAHICMHTYVCTCNTCIHMHMSCTHAFTFTCHAHLSCTYACTYAYTYACAHICMHIQLSYTHAFTCTCHTHAFTCHAHICMHMQLSCMPHTHSFQGLMGPKFFFGPKGPYPGGGRWRRASNGYFQGSGPKMNLASIESQSDWALVFWAHAPKASIECDSDWARGARWVRMIIICN